MNFSLNVLLISSVLVAASQPTFCAEKESETLDSESLALLRGIKQGSVDEVKKYRNQVDLNKTIWPISGNHLERPLAIALLHAQQTKNYPVLEIIQALLEAKIDVDFRSAYFNMSPLSYVYEVVESGNHLPDAKPIFPYLNLNRETCSALLDKLVKKHKKNQLELLESLPVMNRVPEDLKKTISKFWFAKERTLLFFRDWKR